MPTIPLYKIARGGLSTVKRVEADLGPRVSDEAIDKLGRALESAAGIAFIDENGGGPRLCRCWLPNNRLGGCKRLPRGSPQCSCGGHPQSNAFPHWLASSAIVRLTRQR
jgi:hypothetical protein